MKKLLLMGLVLLWAWLGASTAMAQEYVPALGPAFLEDEVATDRLTLSEDDWAFILNPDNAYSTQEWPATFVYESSAGIDTVENVGVRLRGNTSREAAKKSFKVSFTRSHKAPAGMAWRSSTSTATTTTLPCSAHGWCGNSCVPKATWRRV